MIHNKYLYNIAEENKIFADQKDEKKSATQTKESPDMNTQQPKTPSTVLKSTNIEVFFVLFYN